MVFNRNIITIGWRHDSEDATLPWQKMSTLEYRQKMSYHVKESDAKLSENDAMKPIETPFCFNMLTHSSYSWLMAWQNDKKMLILTLVMIFNLLSLLRWPVSFVLGLASPNFVEAVKDYLFSIITFTNFRNLNHWKWKFLRTSNCSWIPLEISSCSCRDSSICIHLPQTFNYV